MSITSNETYFIKHTATGKWLTIQDNFATLGDMKDARAVEILSENPETFVSSNQLITLKLDNKYLGEMTAKWTDEKQEIFLENKIPCGDDINSHNCPDNWVMSRQKYGWPGGNDYVSDGQIWSDCRPIETTDVVTQEFATKSMDNTYACPKDFVVSGVDFRHGCGDMKSMYPRDESVRLKCVRPKSNVSSIELSGFVRQQQGGAEISCPQDKFMTGVTYKTAGDGSRYKDEDFSLFCANISAMALSDMPTEMRIKNMEAGKSGICFGTPIIFENLSAVPESGRLTTSAGPDKWELYPSKFYSCINNKCTEDEIEVEKLDAYKFRCATETACSCQRIIPNPYNVYQDKFCSRECEQPIPDRCSNDTDCDGDNMVCWNGNCVKKNCKTNADCAADKRCIRGICYGGCEKDTDCPSGKKCSKNRCVECSEDKDCSPGQVCNFGACQDKIIPDRTWLYIMGGITALLLIIFVIFASILMRRIITYRTGS